MLDISGLAALDAAIGLAALFFLLATVCSSINEGIASLLGWRAKTLEDAIRNMLGESKDDQPLTTRVFDHWRVASLVRDPASRLPSRRRPSYLPPRAFSRALAEVIAMLPAQAELSEQQREGGTKAASIQARAQATLWKQSDDKLLELVQGALEHVPNHQLHALLDRAACKGAVTLEDFRGHVETSFDDSMQRASGWYKRKVQLVIALLAVVVAIGLNVDTVKVARHLIEDRPVAEAVASRAAALDQTPKQAAESLAAVKQLQLPVGWGGNGPGDEGLLSWIFNRLPGWVLTIAALTLGAPFWFDLLSRLARLRGSGVPERPRSMSDTAGEVPA